MIPVLFKKDEQQFRTYGLGELSDFLDTPEVKRERNGQYTFYMQYASDGTLADKLEEGMKIKSDAGARTKWQTFEINRVLKKSGQPIEVFAKHISMRTAKDALNPRVSGNNLNGQQLLQLWRNNLVGDDHWEVWSDITTQINVDWSIEDYSNAQEVLAGREGSILDRIGGEYEFDNRTIRLWRQMGRTASTVLEYGRNIISVEKDNQEDSVYTSVYPFATYTPEGRDTVEMVTLPEIYLDSDYIEMYDHRKVQLVDFTTEFDFDNPPTVAKLRNLTTQYIENNQVGSPWENIRVEYQDLSKTLDYQDFKVMEEVELNDVVPVYYPQFNIMNNNAKVVVTVYDPVKEEYKHIELGVIGQRFRSVLTDNLTERLNRVEKEQKQQQTYIVNSAGNRIWYSTPDENLEHKIGDTWFEENGQYTRIRIWNGSQWLVKIDNEDIDKNAKAIEEQRQNVQDAKDSAAAANQQINDAIFNAGFTSLNDLTSNLRSISESAQLDAEDALSNSVELQNIVYDVDTGLASVNTQLSNLIQVAVTGDDLSNALSVTENNILAQTVKNGEVVAQLNQEAGRTLIQNDQLLLDVNTVVFGGSAFIPDAAISTLSADKLTAGTIDAAEINVININANSIVGNVTDFVQSNWNSAAGGSVSLDGSGLVTQAGQLSTRINAGEITTISGTKTGKVNALGMQIYDSDNGQTTKLYSDGLEFKWYDIIRRITQTSEGLRITPETGSGNRLNSSLDLRTGPGNDKVAYLQLSVPDASANARLQLAGDVLSLRHPNGGELSISDYSFDEAQGLIRSGTFRTSPYDGQYLEMVGKVIQTPRSGNQNIYIMPNGTGGVTIGSGGSARWPITALRFIEDSNRASKTNINPYTGTGLEVIKSLKVMTYNRKVDLERGINQLDIGFIAEDSPAISIQQPNGPLGVDNYHTVAYAVKAIQELASDADNLLKVASHGLILAEEVDDKVISLESKVKELEEKINRLEGVA